MRPERSSVQGVSERISPDEAIEMAKIAVGGRNTRGFDYSVAEVEILKSKSTTRSENANDTVAYIVNFAKNAGFAVIAGSRKVYPVLAFSEDGSLDSSNELVKDNFLDRIESYLSESVADEFKDVVPEDFESCYVETPKVLCSIGQGAPWNKFVVKDHPNCVAGCVAVATTLVMMHAKSELKYFSSLQNVNTTYNLNAMVKAIHVHDFPYLYPPAVAGDFKRIVGGNPSYSAYTYEQAVDSVASLLYNVGKCTYMNYGEEASSTSSTYAYAQLRSHKYNPSIFYDFDVVSVCDYILDDNLIYFKGREASGQNGHAWVGDGCRVCYDEVTGEMNNRYIHCDWGWNGRSNGYFSGPVFSAGGYDFAKIEYMYIKRASDVYKSPR